MCPSPKSRFSVLVSRCVPALAGVCLLSSTLVLSGCLSRSLTGLTIEPGTGLTTVVPGVSAQYRAIGTYTESGHATETEDISSLVTWSTTIPDVATVNPSGIVTGVSVGTTAVIATIPGWKGQLTAESNIVVASPSGGSGTGRILTSLAIVPTTQTVTTVGETAQFLAIGTYSSAPLTADLTDQVTWQSSDVKVATVNNAGMATSVGLGETTITALGTASDGSVISASASLQDNAPTGPVTLPTLNVYLVGSGMGTVTGPDNINCTSATSSAACTGNFTVGTVVTLTAVPASGSVFDGWSNNCIPTDINGNPVNNPKSPYCTITMSGNSSVGAIFDPQ